MLTRFRAGVAFLATAALCAGCSTIGNQHFYGLARHEYAPIDRFVYKLASPTERAEITAFESFEALNEAKEQSIYTRSVDDDNFSQYYPPEDYDTPEEIQGRVVLELDAEAELDLDESDVLFVLFPARYDVPQFQRGVLHLRHGQAFRFVVLDRTARDDFGEMEAEVRLVEKLASGDQALEGIPELAFRPTDARLNKYAVAPTFQERSRRIEPGMPLTLIANRLYLGRIGEWLADGIGLTRFDTGEIAVVTTIADGAKDQETFLAFYHDEVARKTFVPSWGSVLYSTNSWSGEPLTVKLQVFDLDGAENQQLRSLLETATRTIATSQPQYAPAAGLAQALGELLIEQNTDDEIIRFEFSFVHDTNTMQDSEALAPFNRDYILIRPNETRKTIEPQSVLVNDQWHLKSEEIDSKDSYFTFTVSDSVQVPAALVEKRKREYDELLSSGQTSSLTAKERIDSARAGAQNIISSIEYGKRFQELMLLAKPGLNAVGDKGKIEELKVLAEAVVAEEASEAAGEEFTLVERDRDSLLKSLKARLGEELDGATKWQDVVDKLDAKLGGGGDPPADG